MSGSRVDVRSVDPHDDGALRAWWDVVHAVGLERPIDLTLPWEVDRLTLTTPKVGAERVLLAAYVGAEVVGAVLLTLPTDHNPHLAMVELAVASGHRRRGAGTALLAAAEAVARDDGRGTLLLDVLVPADGDDGPGRSFAEAHGCALANQDVIKVVDLPATADRWPGLAALAAERTAPHRLTLFRGDCPEALVGDVCAMFSRFLAEIPLGDVDLQPQRWTTERLRAVEAARRHKQNDYLMVAAQGADGSLVGYSDVEVPLLAPRVSSIRSTLVLPDARGHRLGLAMKVRLHELTHAEFPDTDLIVTGNAAVNTHMNAVNEALGYVPVERLLEMQKLL